MELSLSADIDAELEPIKLGEAAAHGKRLLGRDEWIRLDTSGKAELVEVLQPLPPTAILHIVLWTSHDGRQHLE